MINSAMCSAEAMLLEGDQGYKYLGMIEDIRKRPIKGSFEKIMVELMRRVCRVCNTKLNGKHTIKSIDEHVIRLIDCHVDLL